MAQVRWGDADFQQPFGKMGGAFFDNLELIDCEGIWFLEISQKIGRFLKGQFRYF